VADARHGKGFVGAGEDQAQPLVRFEALRE
jgi:hypothetical protein